MITQLNIKSSSFPRSKQFFFTGWLFHSLHSQAQSISTCPLKTVTNETHFHSHIKLFIHKNKPTWRFERAWLHIHIYIYLWLWYSGTAKEWPNLVFWDNSSLKLNKCLTLVLDSNNYPALSGRFQFFYFSVQPLKFIVAPVLIVCLDSPIWKSLGSLDVCEFKCDPAKSRIVCGS